MRLIIDFFCLFVTYNFATWSIKIQLFWSNNIIKFNLTDLINDNI